MPPFLHLLTKELISALFGIYYVRYWNYFVKHLSECTSDLQEDMKLLWTLFLHCFMPFYMA